MIALDTNVLLYAMDRRDGFKHVAAQQVIQVAGEGVLLWQVAIEFVSAAMRLKAKGVLVGDSWEHLAFFRRVFPLRLPSTEVLQRAEELIRGHQLQYWDAMIYAAALDAGVTRIYSEDLPGERIEGLEVVNPFA